MGQMLRCALLKDNKGWAKVLPRLSSATIVRDVRAQNKLPLSFIWIRAAEDNLPAASTTNSNSGSSFAFPNKERIMRGEATREEGARTLEEVRGPTPKTDSI